MIHNYEGNSSFSPTIPMLQVAWDSTSLGELKTCPRKYYYSIVLGYAPKAESVHLTFGLHYHASLERYDHARAAGESHEESLRQALDYALTVTWNEKLGRPWLSDDPNKNRLTLIRTIVWYLLQFGENDPLETVILANGKPAVELSFRFETDYNSPDGSPYLLSGHLDKLASFNGSLYIADKKTTKTTLSERFFEEFTPDNQMSLYDFAGAVVYEQPVKGVLVDAAQIAVTFSRFQRGFAPRTTAQREEWYNSLSHWFRQAEEFAQNAQYNSTQIFKPDPASAYPQNDKACRMYGGCAFRQICAHSPQVRSQWLSAHYGPRRWDPLIARGDI